MGAENGGKNSLKNQKIPVDICRGSVTVIWLQTATVAEKKLY